MKYLLPLAGVCVLCQIIFFSVSVSAQTSDSSKSIVFNAQKNPEELVHKEPELEGIASIAIGSFAGFHDQGQFGSFLQPNIGFEFLANPGGPLHYLLGGHIGFINSYSTGISLGIRQLIASPNPDLKFFGDLGILFFDDAAFVRPLKYGARLAFAARTMGSVNMEYRLAGEWRGTGSDSADGYRSRVLWWVGAEVGIAFTLVGERKQISRKDSLEAALHYIASGEEMEDLDAITSDTKMDLWLERFWRIRELSSNPKARDMRSEYEKRVETANRMFSRSKVLGIKTDPGRVMAIYGLPETQKKEYSPLNGRNEYMLWTYSGRVSGFSFAVFLFRKTDNALDWQQVYSNVTGELSGPVPDDIPDSMRGWVGL